MSKHTLGPWVKGNETWEGDGAAGVLVTTVCGDCVAFCTSWTDRGEPEAAQPSDHANANLIAASPDLLEALEELYSLFAPSEQKNNCVLVKAASVIAKAKGEQP